MRVYWSALLFLHVAACSKTRHEGQSEQSVLHVARITASSEHAPDARYTFAAANILDGALNTSWQPAPSDQGRPRWLRLEFDGEVTVTEVAIANGFQTTDHHGDEFLLNRRIATGRLRFGDGSELAIRCADRDRGYIRFAVPNRTTSSLELLIDDTHPGTKWNDLAISELEVRGVVRPVLAVAREPSATTPSPSSVGSSAPSDASWWMPPPGERQSVVALAHGFAGIDENDLGAVFTRDFKPVYAAPHLFEHKPLRRVRRDGMEKLVIKLRDSAQFAAGFAFFFLRARMSYQRERDYQVIRSMEIREVIRIDESARMRPPPDEAVFYLAEVHVGASFDLFVDGRRSDMGARLEALLTQAGGTAEAVHQSGSYRLQAVGLGMRNLTGEGIFAMTPVEIAKRYRTGVPVPVQLVFRTIPGRSYQLIEYAVPTAVVDEPAFLVGESQWKSWQLGRGTYRIDATSYPKGCRPSWSGDIRCNIADDLRGEYHEVSTRCVVTGSAEFTLMNPSTYNLGPVETMSLYIERE